MSKDKHTFRHTSSSQNRTAIHSCEWMPDPKFFTNAGAGSDNDKIYVTLL